MYISKVSYSNYEAQNEEFYEIRQDAWGPPVRAINKKAKEFAYRTAKECVFLWGLWTDP